MLCNVHVLKGMDKNKTRLMGLMQLVEYVQIQTFEEASLTTFNYTYLSDFKYQEERNNMKDGLMDFVWIWQENEEGAHQILNEFCFTAQFYTSMGYIRCWPNYTISMPILSGDKNLSKGGKT